MQIIISIGTDQSFREVISMAEEWLKHLAEEIRVKDHEPAEQTAREARELSLIQQQGPALWRSFADFVEKYVADLIHDLAQDITVLEGPLTCTFNQNNSQIQINKKAFPYVFFSATPNYSQRSAEVSYAKLNPKLLPNQGVGQTRMPCRFEVSRHDKVFLHLDGKEFHEPQEAAKHVMEILFSLP